PAWHDAPATWAPTPRTAGRSTSDVGGQSTTPLQSGGTCRTAFDGATGSHQYQCARRAWGDHAKLSRAPGLIHGIARRWARDHSTVPSCERGADHPWYTGDHDVSTPVESLANLGTR